MNVDWPGCSYIRITQRSLIDSAGKVMLSVVGMLCSGKLPKSPSRPAE